MNIFSGFSQLKLIICIFIFSTSSVTVAEETSLQNDFQVAKSYENQGNFYKATYYYQIILSKDENNTDALYALANIAYTKRQYQVAITRLDTILKNNPYESDALFLRGKIYSLQDQWQEALQDLELVEQLDSENPEIQIALDQVYSEKGETAKAQQSTKNYKRLKAQAVLRNKQVTK